MPSVKRGLLFKYFDKFLCGLVALGLLIGIVYALSRASSLPEQIRPQAVNANVDIIRKRLQAAAKPLAATVPSPASLENVASPPAVRGHVMIWDLPRLYPPIKVGLDKDFVLQFTNSDNSAAAPLGEGTVTVQAAQGMAPPVDVIAHPVDGDYSRVKLHSRAYVGPDGVATANVVGYEGRIAHIYPVIVDSSVNKTAYAPSLNVASAQGTVSLEIVPDARIAQEGVGTGLLRDMASGLEQPAG